MEDEQLLADYMRDRAKVFHGLTREKARILSFEYVRRSEIPCPASWERDGKAGVEWFAAFMKRARLGLRTAEATSLARATGFNRRALWPLHHQFRWMSGYFFFICDTFRCSFFTSQDLRGAKFGFQELPHPPDKLYLPYVGQYLFSTSPHSTVPVK